MTATITQTTSVGAYDQDVRLLHGGLDDVARRQHRYTSGARLLRTASVWLATMFALVVIDAVWPLAAVARAVITIAIVVGIVITSWRLRSRYEDTQMPLCRAARRIETLYNLPSNLIINALWLIPQANQPDHGLTARLAQRVVTSAGHAIQALDLGSVIDRVGFYRQRSRFLTVVLVWMVALFIDPRFVVGGLARFFEPYGDHPPFSLTVFEVAVSPQRPTIGDNVQVTVRLAGRLPNRAELVTVHDGDVVVRRWPMTRSEQGVFERGLLGVREPITLWIESPTGRSKRYRVEPTQPRSTAARDPHSLDAAARRSEIDHDGAHLAGQRAGGGQAVREMSAQLGALADRAGRLREDAVALLGRMADPEAVNHHAGRDRDGTDSNSATSTDAEASASIATSMTSRVTRLNEQINGFAARSKGLSAAAAGGGIPQTMSEPWARVREKLNRLRLPVVAGRVPHAVTTPWLAEVMAAAEHDQRLLEQAQGVLNRALAQGGGVSDDGRLLPGEAASARRGGYDEQSEGARKLPTQADAVTEGIPEEYRQMVGWYFARIASEQGGAKDATLRGR